MSARDYSLPVSITNASDSEMEVMLRVDALNAIGLRLPNPIGSQIYVLEAGQALKVSLRPGCLLQSYVVSKPGVFNTIVRASLPGLLEVARLRLCTCEETATFAAASTNLITGSFWNHLGMQAHASVAIQLGKLRVAPDLVFDTVEIETMTDVEFV